MSENAKKQEKLRRHNTTLQQRILLLEEVVKLAHQQRFGKKGEILAGIQRSLFEEDTGLAGRGAGHIAAVAGGRLRGRRKLTESARYTH